LPLDDTEPRLLPMLNNIGPENDMAIRLSHVPACIPYGVWSS